jgi:hypothetical protein
MTWPKNSGDNLGKIFERRTSPTKPIRNDSAIEVARDRGKTGDGRPICAPVRAQHADTSRATCEPQDVNQAFGWILNNDGRPESRRKREQVTE